MAESGYFGNVWDAIQTTLVGLIVTTRTWIRDPKQTVQYPDVDIRTGQLRPTHSKGAGKELLQSILSFAPRRAMKAGGRAIAGSLYGDLTHNKADGYDGRLSMKIADRYRGILNVDIEICTACLACSRACPIDCIQIDATKEGKQLRMERFDIDIALCMYCGLCSAPCPTGAIHHTKEFEASTSDFPDLIRRFIDEPRIAYRAKKLKVPFGTEEPAPAAPAPETKA